MSFDKEESIWEEDGFEDNGNLDIYYTSQFVEGEEWVSLTKHHNYLILEYTPVLPGSLTGSVIHNDIVVARFVVAEGGKFQEFKNGQYSDTSEIIQLDKCSINNTTGEMYVYCNLDDFDLKLDYEYNLATKNDTYYVPGDDDAFPVAGYLCQCKKCGRKIVVELGLFGINHAVGVIATCADCVEITEEFKKLHPELAEQIGKQITEFKNT